MYYTHPCIYMAYTRTYQVHTSSYVVQHMIYWVHHVLRLSLRTVLRYTTTSWDIPHVGSCILMSNAIVQVVTRLYVGGTYSLVQVNSFLGDFLINAYIHQCTEYIHGHKCFQAVYGKYPGKHYTRTCCDKAVSRRDIQSCFNLCIPGTYKYMHVYTRIYK